MLDATAGGVVQADEQLLESARREAEEELGIAGVPLPSTGSSISKIKIAVSGARCSVASLTVPSPYRKMKSVKFAG